MVLVDIRDYSFQYLISDQPALKEINLKLHEGKLYSVIGPNGAGKTTLAHAIRGFVPKFHVGEESGQVEVFQQQMKDLSLADLASRIGLVFQNPFTQMSTSKQTVFDEIAFGLENLGVPHGEMVDRVNDVLVQTQTDDLRDKHPLELSGGQQQRVAIAAVLVMDQDLLIFDEPTSQLDPQSTDLIFEIIRELKDRGKTVLLIEHKIDHIAAWSDEIIVMDQGQIVMQGPADRLFEDPAYADLDLPLPTASQLSLDLYEAGVSFTDVPLTLEGLCQQVVDHRRRLVYGTHRS